jgi:TfoX/Sxy family transcriptional regulator of competence genes
VATDLTFVQYLCDQLQAAGPISYRKMFGEYALYCGTKVVALVCDNQLFIKPTPGGRAVLGTPAEAPPYPSAKPHFLIQDQIEDRELMTRLLRVTTSELPEPKPKKPRAQPRTKPAPA